MNAILERLSRMASIPSGIHRGERNVRFNYFLGILNGAFLMFGFAFMHPNTVLPVFVTHFTQSDFIIGLASAIQRAAWYLPQLFVAGYSENLTHKRSLYLQANVIRLLLVWLTIPLLAFCGLSHPEWTLFGFLVLLGLSSIWGGIAGLPYSDIVGKTIPGPYLGQFYATRLFFGAGLFSILAGVVVRFVLSDRSPLQFPVNYVVLFSMGASLMTIGTFVYGFVREPPGKVSRTRRSFPDIVRSVPSLLERDRNFSRFLGVLVFGSGLAFSLPFYVIMAQRSFGASISATGTFLATQTLGVMLSNVLWGWLSRRSGNVCLLQVTTLGQIFVPVYALVLYYFAPEFLGQGPVWVVTAAFSPIFFFVGAFISGGYIACNSYVLTIAPEVRRPTYIGITNLAIGVSALYPALGGILGQMFGLATIFYISVAFTGLGFILSLTLHDKHVTPSAQ